ncbi:hypothetical protein [Sphingobacterium kitahiroshimense]|uniref:hypothetical protein n=1 Tax=Sphingobacterium kitahiroshimense TaxID=470446 RepID=UPI0032084504
MKKKLILISIVVFAGIVVLFIFRRKTDLETDFSRNVSDLNHPQILATDQHNSEIKNSKKEILLFNRQNATFTILHNIFQQKKDTVGVLNLNENLRKELIINIDNYGNEIFLFQPQKKRVFITNFSKNTDSVIASTTFLYTRGSLIDKESFIVKESSDNLGLNDVFAVYKINQGDRVVLENVLPKLNDGGIGLDGFFASNGDGRNIFVTYYTNEAFVFSKGKFTKSFAVIGGKKNAPEIISKRPGLYSMKEIETAFSENGEVFSDNLYILSNVIPKGDKRQGKYIDVYDLETVKYKKSYFISDYKGKPVKDFAIANNLLLALHDDILVQYTLQ